MILEEHLRLIDKVRVKILAQIVFNVARYSYQYAALHKKKRAADDARADYLERRDCQVRPGNLAPVCVNRVANNQGNVETGNDAGQDTKDANRQRKFVRKKKAREFS
jgi:hypothetical protein